MSTTKPSAISQDASYRGSRNQSYEPRNDCRKAAQRGRAAANASSLEMNGHKNRKNTKASAQLARAPIGAMEIPDITFEILRFFAAMPVVENLRGARRSEPIVAQKESKAAAQPACASCKKQLPCSPPRGRRDPCAPAQGYTADDQFLPDRTRTRFAVRPMGAMETPETIFEILCLFAAIPALEHLRGA